MVLNTELYDGCESIEFKITNTNKTVYYFPDIPSLRGKLIRRIDFNYNSNPLAYSMSDYVIISQTASKDFYLTLVSKDKEVVKDYPFYNLIGWGTTQNKLELFNHYFDLSKSYITISDTSNISANQAFVVTIYYQKPKKVRFTYELENLKVNYIEAIVKNTSEKILNFSNFSDIQNSRIYKILFFNTGGATYYSPDKRQIIANTNMAVGYITLWDKEKYIVKDLPIARLVNDFAAQQQIYWNGLIVDWEKSYLNVSRTNYLTADHVFYLPVYYR